MIPLRGLMVFLAEAEAKAPSQSPMPSPETKKDGKPDEKPQNSISDEVFNNYKDELKVYKTKFSNQISNLSNALTNNIKWDVDEASFNSTLMGIIKGLANAINDNFNSLILKKDEISKLSQVTSQDKNRVGELSAKVGKRFRVADEELANALSGYLKSLKVTPEKSVLLYNLYSFLKESLTRSGGNTKNALKKYKKASKESRDKLMRKIDGLFDKLGNYVKTKFEDLKKDEFDKTLVDAIIGFAFSKKFPNVVGLDEEIKRKVNDFENLVQKKKTELRKSKNSNDFPIYPKLAWYSSNIAKIYLILFQNMKKNNFNIKEVTDYMNKWNADFNRYTKRVERGEARNRKLEVQVSRVIRWLDKYDTNLLSPLLEVSEGFNQISEKVEDSIVKLKANFEANKKIAEDIHSIKNKLPDVEDLEGDDSGEVLDEEDKDDKKKLGKSYNTLVKFWLEYKRKSKKLKEEFDKFSKILSLSDLSVDNRINLINLYNEFIDMFEDLYKDCSNISQRFANLHVVFSSQQEKLVRRYGDKVGIKKLLVDFLKRDKELKTKLTELSQLVTTMNKVTKRKEEIEKGMISVKLTEYFNKNVTKEIDTIIPNQIKKLEEDIREIEVEG